MFGAKTHHIPPILLVVPNAQLEMDFPHSTTASDMASDESLLGKRLFAAEFCELTHVDNTDRASYARQSVQASATGRGMDRSGREV